MNPKLCKCGGEKGKHPFAYSMDKVEGGYVMAICNKFTPVEDNVLKRINTDKYTKLKDLPDTKNQEESLSVKIWEVNHYDIPFIFVKDLKSSIKKIIERIDNAQEDYANLDWISKEQALKIIKQEVGSPLTGDDLK